MDIRLGEIVIQLERSKLKTWITLDNIRGEIVQAVDSKNDDLFVDLVYSYLSTACSFNKWEEIPWFDVLDVMSNVTMINNVGRKFPIFGGKEKKEEKELPWKYYGREWYEWANLFSKEYGWTIEYISNLDVEDAIGLLQEIKLNEQFKKEWEWELSEKSIGYDPKSKTSKFIKLPRPDWMLPEVKLQKFKFPRAMLPYGNVVDLSGIPFGEDTKPS